MLINWMKQGNKPCFFYKVYNKIMKNSNNVLILNEKVFIK